MKVLHLVKTSRGASWALRQMRELKRLGVDVHVALPPGGPLVPNSDFPHSGPPTSYALLGDYSVPDTDNYTVYTTGVLIRQWGPNENIDAVCLRCHPGIGTHN